MHSSINTFVIVAIFSVCYLYFTARETAKQKLDIYDLVMLSAVAIIPTAFVLFPGFADSIARLAEVAFPFEILFGALFAVLFIFIHRLTVKIHCLEADNRLLIQEVSLLKTKVVSDCWPGHQPRAPGASDEE